MIVLDEQLNDPVIQAAFARWYRGQVIVINDLRPGSVIKDDAIAALLLDVRQPTFITINYTDFWRRIKAHPRYSVICLRLTQDRDFEVSEIVREMFRSPLLATKATRMGRVFSWREGDRVDFYE
jgi:hypothetical protein